MMFLIISALTVGFLHALAPDHWLPFTALGRANGWSRSRLAGVMLLAGCAHLITAFALGFLAIHWGFSLAEVTAWDGSRARILPFLLVGFGLAYLLWALKMETRLPAAAAAEKRSGSLKILFFLVIFGPCEPLVPILFASALKGWHSILATSAVFSLATLMTMVLAAQAAYLIPKCAVERKSVRFSNVLAGGLMVVSGIVICIFGI